MASTEVWAIRKTRKKGSQGRTEVFVGSRKRMSRNDVRESSQGRMSKKYGRQEGRTDFLVASRGW